MLPLQNHGVYDQQKIDLVSQIQQPYHQFSMRIQKANIYDGSHDQIGNLHKRGKHSKTTSYSYLPTPPLGQDMTQGQFLSGV